jgi:hypothetical protein
MNAMMSTALTARVDPRLMAARRINARVARASRVRVVAANEKPPAEGARLPRDTVLPCPQCAVNTLASSLDEYPR